ncbi:putative repeat protein (TIGR01451 family) [Breoghania corrubedonensis]|uniref:Putative repeat protein (TIGR01451 family) n=1 Tax=Breoghania corrubedonensis TaxID=665038 RepID=A0A2T5VGW6_9HYPH|nr:autotransporter outer membrane beta-barrel domain-containing protein [Breoghania corrubedonensis]PTW62978.1 putative repeat protein (TIGR01451 family) [Breoghania corrubedonensis]
MIGAKRVLAAIGLLLAATIATAHTADAQPTFSAQFSPSTIAAGAESRLIFTITNGSGSPVTAMTFTDTLPAGTTVAASPRGETTCIDGVVTVNASDTFTFEGNGGASGASVAADSSCTVSIYVTASTGGAYNNTSGDLTSSAGNSGTASATLTVDAARLEFDMAFSPATVGIGAASRITYTITKPNSGVVTGVAFNNTLPTGLQVASPSSVATSCTGGAASATTGSQTVQLSGAFFTAAGSCTVTVDVTNTGAGTYVNSAELSSSAGTSGAATATLTVTAPTGDITLIKQFARTAAAPGGTIEMTYTLANRSSSSAATAITFTDDLDAALSGLTASALPATGFCGVGSQLTGSSTLTLSGATLGSRESCSFTVTLDVPASASDTTVTSTTSSISGQLGGSPVTGDPASASFNVVTTTPVMTKSFTDDPVSAGGTVTLQYVISNPSTITALGSIAFTDSLAAMADAAVTAGTGSNLCGSGSFLFTQEISGTPSVVLNSGTLAAGASCTLTLTLTLPANTPAGDYASTSSDVTSDGGTGAPASDTLQVSPPDINVSLSKTFTDDPVRPGDTVTLEFTLRNDDEATAITDLAFTDDLDAMLTGAVATGLPASNVCGTGSTVSGTSTIALSGGNLAASDECTFSVTVQVPGGAAAGSYPNTTSDVSGDSGSGIMTATGSAATGTLVVSDVLAVTGTMSFTDDPVVAGSVVTLQYVLSNPNTADDATSISFSDNLNGLGLPSPGLVLSGSLPSDPCGTGSSLSLSSGGTAGTLSLSGGNILASGSCTFSIQFTVPSNAAANTYGNTTSVISSTVNSTPLTSASGMNDTLSVSSPYENIIFTKTFTDDPAEAGSSVTLRFVLDNSVNSVAIDGATFTDDLTAMGFAATVTADSGSCSGGGSWNVTGTTTISASVSNLPGGATCTFDVAVAIPSGTSPGISTNTTSTVAVTIGAGSGSVAAASDDLTISPTNVTLQKSFSGDPVLPGGTFSVTYTILSPASGSALSDIRFTDDYDAVLSGLVVSGALPSNPCGAGSALAGTTSIELTGGSLNPSETCQFTVNLAAPSNATPNTYTSTSGALFETAAQIAPPASDTFEVANPADNVTFALQFTDDPVAPGGTATAQFTITNPDSVSTVSGLAFTMPVDAVITGATVSSATPAAPCGGAVVSGTSSLSVSGGSLAAGANCSFTVSVLVPLGTTSGSNSFSTSTLAATANSTATTVSAASDTLVVGDAPQFTVTSGDFNTSGAVGGPFNATMDYVISNTGSFPLSYTAAASQAFIGLSSTGGTIAAGGSQTVTVSITATANGFAASATPYSGTVTFTNISASGPPTEIRNVNLTVQQLGSVTVMVNSSQGDGTFTFSSSATALNGLAITTSNGAGSSAAVDVVAGSYTLSLPKAGMPDGFGLAGISCTETGGTSNSSASVGSATATIVVETGEAITCVFETANSRERTTAIINRFLSKRVDLILSNEPGQNRRIDRLRNRFGGGASGTGTPFDVTATQAGAGGVAMAFETSLAQIRSAYVAQDRAKQALLATSGVFAHNPSGLPPEQTLWDVWFRGSFTWFEDNSDGSDSDGVFAIFHAGADYLVSDRILVGALVQLDYMDQDFTTLNANANGVGWMAGPYATLRLTNNLYFDTRAAWGTSFNQVSPFNTYTDDFSTTRWLVRAGLIGDWAFGAWNFRPSANVAYMQETQEAYTDSLSVEIPEQTVGVGQLDFGPEISYTYQTETGYLIAPSAKLTGIWNFKRDTYGVTTTTSSAGVEMRAKAELGLNVRMPSGVRVEANGSYDGIGAEDYNAVSGQVKLSVPLN